MGRPRIAHRCARKAVAVVVFAVAAVGLGAGAAQAATYLYVAERQGQAIHQLSLDADGDPTYIGAYTGADNPWGLAVSPDKRSLYAASNGDGTVAQFDINQSTGALTSKSPATVPTGAGPAYVVMSPDGRSLYVTNTFANSISQYDVAADGTLSAKTPATLPTAALPQRMLITPDGTSLYSVDRGNNPRTIRQYTIGAQGLLTPKTPATVPSPGRPEGMAMSVDGSSLYVSSSFGSTLITQWNIAPGSGLLTAKTPATAPGSGNTAGLVLSPDGTHAYLTEGDGLTVLSYDVSGGLLTQRPGPDPSFSLDYPLDSLMSPRGNSLYLTAGARLNMFDVLVDGSLRAKATPLITFASVLHGLAIVVLPDPVPPAPGESTPTPTPTPTPTGPVPATTLPSAPLDLHARPGDRTVGLAFRPPSQTGSSAIRRYEARVGSGTWKTLRTAGTTRLIARITGVQNGRRLSITVRARNASGAGAATPSEVVHTAMWFADPLTRAQRRRLMPIPSDLHDYTSATMRRTRSYALSFRGIAVMDMPAMRGRALQTGEGGTVSDRGLFKFDSAKLTPKGRREARLLVPGLRYTEAVRCEGYTDYAGEAGHELKLSRARSRAMCRTLRAYGADVRTSTVGYGGVRPVVVGGTARAREDNRRVVVVVTR